MKLMVRFFVAVWVAALAFITINPARPVHAAGASFYMSPASGNVKIGDTVSASVLINSGGQAINAGQGSVTFSTDVLEFQSVSTSGSIFAFWTNGPIGTSTAVNFGGGLSNPGYNGSSGTVLTIYWKAKALGTASISVNGNKILANDGKGTNVLGGSSGASFTVYDPAANAPKPTPRPTPTPPAPVASITSSTHPDPTKWYASHTVSFAWGSVQAVAGYIFSFDHDPNLDQPAGDLLKVTSKTYNEASDGVWYFHLRPESSDHRGKSSTFKVMIDGTAPDPFTTTIIQEGGTTNPVAKVSFDTGDSGSGIDHIDAILDGSNAFPIANGDSLPKQRPGNHTLIVRAYDKAGNSTESHASFKVIGIDPPGVISFSKLVALLDPIHITGSAKATDTVYVYLDDKVVDHFTVKDKVSDQSSIKDATADVVWDYTYSNILLPGKHTFRISRSDLRGAESELSQALSVEVELNTIKIRGHNYQTKYIIGSLLGIILLLLLIILYLLRRVWYLSRHHGITVKDMSRRMRLFLSRSEKDIMREIEKTIPEGRLKKEEVQEMKEEIQDKIHETLKLDLADELDREKEELEDPASK